MRDTTVAFHELSFVPEGDEVVVGRKDTGSFAVLPSDGAALLGRLTEGEPLDEAARWYESTFGEPVDIDDFLETLRDLGFVRAGDTGAPPPQPVRLRRLGRLVFSPAAWLCYAVIVVAWVVAVAGHHDLLPNPHQIFFTSSLVLVQLGITVGQVPLIFLHEASHMLAARRLGLPSRLGMSNRFTYVVFETRMNGLLSVPSGKRYLPLLSGMATDVVALSLLGLLAAATRDADGTFSLAGRVALALAFTVVMRLGWQFQFYLRTDLYYVLATALRCHDLHEASTTSLRNRIWRLLGRPERMVGERQWSERDRRMARWYGPLVVFGIAVMLALTVLATVPVVWYYAGTIARHLGTGRFDLEFADAVFSLAFNAGWLFLAVYLAKRKRREARPHRPHQTVAE